MSYTAASFKPGRVFKDVRPAMRQVTARRRRGRAERAFFELAERFRAASDPEQVKHLGDELGRFVFGE